MGFTKPSYLILGRRAEPPRLQRLDAISLRALRRLERFRRDFGAAGADSITGVTRHIAIASLINSGVCMAKRSRAQALNSSTGGQMESAGYDRRRDFTRAGYWFSACALIIFSPVPLTDIAMPAISFASHGPE